MQTIIIRDTLRARVGANFENIIIEGELIGFDGQFLANFNA
jgi:hypothetical protein